MKFSAFGQRFSRRTGTRELMDDLGAVAADRSRWINLGGGNPSVIPSLQPLFVEALGGLDAQADWLPLLNAYDSPQGHRPFLEALAVWCNERLGWRIGAENLLVTPGSQASFFMLFNLFGGPDGHGGQRRILLPQCPEYIGYSESWMAPGQLASCPSRIELAGERQFRYEIDFDSLPLDERVAALCLSRPSNPTGKFASDAELERLAALARARDLPLIIDAAYGLPFPGIVFEKAVQGRAPGQILCLSLSKLGLPGARTGIVVADTPVIDALVGMNAMMSLAPNPLGARLALELMRRHDLSTLAETHVRAHYAERSRAALDICADALQGLPWRVHRSEGAIFLWLWFPGLPVPTSLLYERLKARGVLVIPGSHFGPGLAQEWPHLAECIRVSYAQPDAVLSAGFAAIADELRAAWAGRQPR
jgi:valine--pyruvate aminotransferase